MRYLVWFGGIIVAIVVTLYVVAFTPLGNGLIKPIVESKIAQNTKLESKLNTFLLSMSDFEIVLELNKDNIIEAKGSYSLFSQAFNLIYNIDLKNLQSLKSLVGTNLNGTLHTNGTAKGNKAFMEIDGKSNIAKSITSYHVELTGLNPTSIIADVKSAKLASLLYMAAKNPYATADIDLNVNFKNINPHVMDGDIILKTKDAKIDPKYMKSDFNVTIPQTLFSMNLNAKLKGDDIDYDYKLLSNLFNINSSGKVVPQPLKTDIVYALDIQNLEALKPITGADIRGSVKLQGIVKGEKKNLLVKGSSDVASSNTDFEAVLKDFALSTLRAKIQNLDIAKLLYMLKQPHYSDGLFSMDADIKDARVDNLDGRVVTTVTNGVLDSAYLTKAYEFKSAMPKTTFSSTTASVLNGDNIDTKITINSSIANLEIEKAKFNIKDSSIKSDYEVKILDLDKLFFITQTHMRGSLTADGELSKAKDLDFTFHTRVADGKIDAKLHNDNFYADINSVKVQKILYMLLYPEVVDAAMNAKVDYNLLQSKGTFKGQVANTVFAKNQAFDLIKQYAKFDMYKEFFNGDVDANINKEKIVASVDLRSKNAAIKTKDAKIDTKAQKIDADITIVAKNDTISANLSGDINSPKVTIDLEKFLKSQAGQKAIKEVNKLFKKLF